MYTKAKKTISHVTPSRSMTPEEQKQRIMQFLQQRRESFSINILSAVAHGADTDWTDAEIKDAVDLSVKMADALMEKLYPMSTEEKPMEETPVQTDFD